MLLIVRFGSRLRGSCVTSSRSQVESCRELAFEKREDVGLGGVKLAALQLGAVRWLVQLRSVGPEWQSAVSRHQVVWAAKVGFGWLCGR
jgi:hypothetical protein